MTDPPAFAPSPSRRRPRSSSRGRLSLSRARRRRSSSSRPGTATAGSPLYADLCRPARRRPAPGGLDPRRRGSVGSPLRLLGGLHYLVLSGVAPSALSVVGRRRRGARGHEATSCGFVAEQGVQTNEVQRSWVLVPRSSPSPRAAGLPLDLVELGPSAGLNLVWDRYRCRYAAGTSAARRRALVLDAARSGRGAGGAARDADRGRHAASGSTGRRSTSRRTRAAAARASCGPTQTSGSRASTRRSRRSCGADPPELIQGDFVDVLPDVLAERAEERLTVVFQTAVDRLPVAATGTPSSARRSRRRRPTAGRSPSSPTRRFDETGPSSRTSGGSRSASGRAPIALRGHADYHGAWLDWLGRMITSKDNAKLKLVRELERKKERDETGLFAGEGEDLVRRRAAAGIEPVELLVAGENVEPELLAGVSTLPHPARAIGVFRRGRPAARPRDRCLALWRLADPGNVGTLLRTADAFGAAVALSDGCADPLSQKALRACAGAIFRVPLVAWDELQGVARARRARRRAARRGRSRAAGDVPARLRAEGPAGRSSRQSDVRRRRSRCPGEAESLNVAAAGAIALYELSRALTLARSRPMNVVTTGSRRSSRLQADAGAARPTRRRRRLRRRLRRRRPRSRRRRRPSRTTAARAPSRSPRRGRRSRARRAGAEVAAGEIQ